MLTFVLVLAPLVWLLNLLEQEGSPFRGWASREERLQFERELDSWRTSDLP